MSTNDVGPGPTVDKIEAAWDAIAQAWSRARAHQLERSGLVERSPDATDGRTVRLRLTVSVQVRVLGCETCDDRGHEGAG